MDESDDAFSPTIKRQLADRAANICSNPACGRLTVGPTETDPVLATRVGVAAHIRGNKPGAARYDPDQSSSERKGIGNGIWLCVSCSVLIDKNGGSDYPPELLQRWKDDHQRTLKAYIEGTHRIRLVGPFGDRSEAAALLYFLEDRGVLFQPWKHEYPQHVFESVKEIRTYVTSLLPRLETSSPLHAAAEMIGKESRQFMNATSAQTDHLFILSALGAFRKAVGITIRDLAAGYQLKVSGPLGEVLTSGG